MSNHFQVNPGLLLHSLVLKNLSKSDGGWTLIVQENDHYIKINEILGELSGDTMISSDVKISPLL